MGEGRRHVCIEYYYVVQEVRAKIIDIWYIPNSGNPADGFTKPLPIDSLRNFWKNWDSVSGN